MEGRGDLVAGRFRIDGLIGRGNMGEVHRAEDMRAPENSRDRAVAVKLILQGRHGGKVDTAGNRKSVDRFAREVRIMRRLSHPNIPQTVDGGVDGSTGTPYLAMELLSGRELRDLINEEPQAPVSWVAAIGTQIADALAAAHHNSVIHRDLKPANVMLLQGGQVKVLDFGMGRIIDDPGAERITSSGTVVGTARYMAPEQFRTRDVTQAADLYALGCVLYELLVGVPPFQDASFSELGRRHAEADVPPLRLQRRDVPAGLARLVERQLLAKDPADRPVDAAAVRDALLPYMQGGAIVSGWEAFNPAAYLAEGTTKAAPATPAEAPGVETGMDIFELHRRLIADYRDFTGGGTVIRDERIKAFVEDDLDAKSQWPDPWVSLNPFFATGGSVASLAGDGVLDDECARIFQKGKTLAGQVCDGRPLTLHKHQREAIAAAQSGASYVLTTGTGSGKSLSYIVPIVDGVLKAKRTDSSKRVRAIIVYPMNALANSQLGELKKFLRDGYGEGREPVTFARYTSQEDMERRKELRDEPPDILLTNYVMLELMLTRPEDRRSLIKMAEGMEFLVFDELHTYRGRQGADVALLIRRVREACRTKHLQCIGTSATMATDGTVEDQKAAVARVATMIFGTSIGPEQVIGETLVRATDPSPAAVSAERLRMASPAKYADLVQDPLARWVETRFGLDTDEKGRLVRRHPTRIEDAARELAEQSGVDKDQCSKAIRGTLEAGSRAVNPVNERPLFAFRLHQFLSKGDTVYVTLEEPKERHLTRDYQIEQPGSGGKILLPLSFCRECGQEYLTAWRTVGEDGSVSYRPRRDAAATGGRSDDGYLYINPDRAWPHGIEQAIADRRLPDSWLELDHGGQETVKKSYRDRLPRNVTVDAYGHEGQGELRAAFVPAPFAFCLHCGVTYEQVRGKDFAKLARLDQEGRSSATSLISASIVRSLKAMPPAALPATARKLLTFVDNRQDASLQAGHFNDFVQVTQLRGALYRAVVEAGPEGLTHENLAASVAGMLALDPADYTGEADLPPRLANLAAETLQNVIAFRLYLDLERGWRVTMPNLEQTGLLRIDYADLDWLAAKEERWADAHIAVKGADPGQRSEIMRALLDEMRRSLAIDVQYFRDDFTTLQRASEERLVDPWVLDPGDRPKVGTAYPQPSRPGMDRAGLFLSGRGKFGKYLRRRHFKDMSVDDASMVIEQLFKILKKAGIVTAVEASPQYARPYQRRSVETVTGYRVAAAALIWRAGSGEVGAHDELTRTYAAGDGPRVNVFFRDLYRNAAGSLAGLLAREHTAQVDSTERRRREELFSNAELKLLYCSPTMELGVDIADLNTVMMRNVPPTPANYAQRSGRAGRGGQPALVTTYCATGNSHDQYYFRRSDRMVAGSVVPPRLDLANEDLVLSHVRAIWLAETRVKLGTSIPYVIDIGYDEDARIPRPELLLHDNIAHAIRDEDAQAGAVAIARQVLADVMPKLRDTTWWDDSWLEEHIRHTPEAFDRAFDRWRELFRAALVEQAEQNRRVLDHNLIEGDRKKAVSRRREAETQLALLKNESVDSRTLLSDFNPYRYLASEGFLPGYSFPRLPLAAYIPTAGRRFKDGDYLQRPRFLAIREFGPGALVYHEGSRYQVTHVQLPPDRSADVSTGEAKRCGSCGYFHEPRHRADRCQLCGTPLGMATTGLLHLHTVFTRRRERISSDEEERRRAGFRLVTSYRFAEHGKRPGRQDAVVSDSVGRIATLHYGDSATVRRINLGRIRAKPNEPDGFWLDPADGRWLNESDAAKAAGDSSELPIVDADGNERGRKKRVIPYVQDSRNICLLKMAQPLVLPVALSLMYALERGVETAYELEDAELNSELLPDDKEGPRDRMLFTEAAEGGAGVLRLLQSEPDALARAAASALEVCHFDADGSDTNPECARGCYDCLLTYGNQGYHTLIDRHSIRDPLRRLAGAKASPVGAGESRTDQMERLARESDTGLEGEFVRWLKENGYRLPDQAQAYVAAARACPDFAYHLPSVNVAVFIDGPVHDHTVVAQRDAAAEERLVELGWDVIRIPHDGDWTDIVGRYRSYFGPGAHH